ncbi:hypothetical protein CBOM_01967 [Ceraceosorus bombacis]|uniref:Uncharacterized protein n=1 Tax=Ceraceosorus bombacis TaxID=401625 RepID=A0A0N7L9L1_9BASI|nr:hypothetical protein CBOM_01967 [Ceraceosorus bombacis]
MNCTAPINNNEEKKLRRMLIQLGITSDRMLHKMESREEYKARVRGLSREKLANTAQNQHFPQLCEVVSNGKQGLKLEMRKRRIISGSQLAPMNNYGPMLYAANWVIGTSHDPWANEPAPYHGHAALQRMQACMFEDVAKIQRASKQGHDLARDVVLKATAHYDTARKEGIFYLGYWCDRRNKTYGTMRWWGSKDLTQISSSDSFAARYTRPLEGL